MSNEAFKAWLDAMPVEDVQRKIERLEQKLSDLLVLTRLHADRQPGGSETAGEPAPAQEGWPGQSGAIAG